MRASGLDSRTLRRVAAEIRASWRARPDGLRACTKSVSSRVLYLGQSDVERQLELGHADLEFGQDAIDLAEILAQGDDVEFELGHIRAEPAQLRFGRGERDRFAQGVQATGQV